MILFSPIGTTDPLRNYRDGAMLHIVRHYHEYGLWKVVLFYTKEMTKIEQEYHPYTRSIKKIVSDMDIEEIFTDITEPQRFDEFIDIFPKTIYDLHERYPDEKIILNISSGTPQMQSALAILAVECPYTLAVQVNTPTREANRDLQYIKSEDDFLKMFKHMADDDPQADMRCVEPPLRTIRKHSDKNQIFSLIDRYEYDAAFTIAEKNADIPDSVKHLLQHAAYRMKLQPKDACKIIDKYNGEKLCPYKGSKRTLMEYFLTIQVDQKKSNLFGVLIKSMPFLYEFLLTIFLYDKEFNVESLCTCQGLKDFRLCRHLLQKNNSPLLDFLDQKFSGFRDAKLSAVNLMYICEFAAENSASAERRELYRQIFDIINHLTRNDVLLLRNDVAHIISDVDETKFKEMTGFGSKQLVDNFLQLLLLFYGDEINRQSNFYGNLNDWIRAAMEQ